MRTTKSAIVVSILMVAACGDRSTPAANPEPPRPTSTELATGFVRKGSEAFAAQSTHTSPLAS